MGATTLYFNGRRTARPGAYSKVDASAFAAAGLGASGIVAVLGTSVGGRPYNAVRVPDDDLQRATNSTQIRELFREGDLRELGSILFDPAADEEIDAGAQEVVFVKVNPSAPSEATFANNDGDVLKLTSRDYGLFTTQIKAEIADASSGTGKQVKLSLEDTEELFDLLGGDAKFSLTYDGGADGATAARATALVSAFQVAFDRADAGLDGDFTQPAPGSSLEAISDNVADDGTLTVYGLDALNAPAVQSVALNGTTAVPLGGVWNLVTAAALAEAQAGGVIVRIADAGATVVSLAAGQTSKGRVALDIPVKGALTVVGDGPTVRKLVYRGVTIAGAPLAEAVTLNDATPVALTGAFARLTSVELGNVEAARSVTVTGLMVDAPVASYPNLQRLKDLVNANTDFTLTTLIGNPKDFLVTNLDRVSDANVKSPATASFYARLADIVDEINAASQLVEAQILDGATGAPNNTGAPVFLSGGHEGDPLNPGVPSATFADWQAGLDLLKQVYVNTLVPATDDEAVHAAGVAHCEYMGGAGKMERDIVVGAAPDETVAQLKARALALNSRHVRLCPQEVSLFNTAGERVWQPPMFQAAIVAGMQAGTSVGNPLTNKIANVLGVRQHSSWNPVDNGEELLLGGVMFMQLERGRGYNVVRNLTTHLSDSNLAFVDAHVNQATNRAVYELRTRMQRITGKKGFAGTIKAAAAAGELVLDQLIREEIIVAYDKPTFELIGDSLPMSVGLSPVVGINFVPITVNLKPFSLVG